MISDEELKNRQAFEAALVAAGSLMSTAWDDDYSEYVYDDAEQMYRGWILAQDIRLDSELAKVAEPVVLDLSGVETAWVGTPQNKWLIDRAFLLAAIRAQLPGVEIKC